jgi:hypothetical protein
MSTLTTPRLCLYALLLAGLPRLALAQQPVEPAPAAPPAAPTPVAPAPGETPDAEQPPGPSSDPPEPAPAPAAETAPAAPAPPPAAEAAAEIPTVFPPPVDRPAQPKREKRQRTTVGMHPAAVDFGAEADIVSNVGLEKPPPDNRRWSYALRGFLRAPMRVGIGPETGTFEGNQLHSPPRIVGLGPDEWTYLNLAPASRGQLRLAVTNTRVEGHIVIQGDSFWDAGYPNLVKMGGFSQAWVTLKSPALFGTKGGAALSVGAFSERFGNAGPYQQSTGYYGTYLFGRTHVAGESLVLNYDLTDGIELVAEHGLGAKVEVTPFRKNNPPIAPYLPNQGPTPQGSNFVHHAHAGFIVGDWLTVMGHYLSSWSPNDLQEVTETPAKEARMTIVGGEVHTDHPVAGHGYLGYSYIDAKRILPLADGVQVLHGSTGLVFKENYFGRLPQSALQPLAQGLDPAGRDDSGQVQTVLFQYLLRAAPLFGRTQPGPDLALAVFGMLNHVTAPKSELNGTVVAEEYTLEQDKLKFGGELQFAPIELLSLGLRFDQVMPDGGNADVAYSALSPRIVMHSKWIGREYVILNYTKFTTGSGVRPSRPYTQPDPPELPYPTVLKPDQHLVSLTALVAF